MKKTRELIKGTPEDLRNPAPGTKIKIRHGGRTWWVDADGKMIAGSVKNVTTPSAATKTKLAARKK